jgi:hypothetical protein
MVNGDRPQSKFISHLSSYPVVSDGVETFKSNPYGRKSLDLADSAYQRVVKPVEPHLETAYSYAKPYVGKADELGDSGLGYIDSKFPIVKEDTSTIVDKGKSIVLWPFKVANDGKDYVVNTWSGKQHSTLPLKLLTNNDVQTSTKRPQTTKSAARASRHSSSPSSAPS